MVEKNWFKRHFVWTGVIGVTVLFILTGIFSGCGDSEAKRIQTILEGRQNFHVVVTDWEALGWGRRYNTNTDKEIDSDWTKLELYVTNNEHGIALDGLTIAVHIRTTASLHGDDTISGRLFIDVSDIKPGDSKTMTVYYPADFSRVTDTRLIYATIRNDIPEDKYKIFKELQ